MGLTVYLLDEEQQQRAAIRGGITELIHSEADGALTMEMASGRNPHPGEYIAFLCRDGRHRLFCIESSDEIDDEGVDAIEATDAAREELQTTISNGVAMGGMTASESLTALLAGTGWELGVVEADGDVGEIAPTEYEKISDAMIRIADTAKVRLVPYYELTGGKVTGKKIDILSAEPVWRGRIISARTAADIVLTEEQPAMGRVYAIGGYTAGSGEERKRITLADVEWSTAAGDPAEKPAGQDYMDAEEWRGAHRRAFVYTNASQRDPQALAQEAWEALQQRAKPRLTGRANAGDITFAEGYSHAEVRVNDLVGVRSRSGRAVQERVANVRWHYIFADLTVFEFGEEQRRLWITTQIAETAQTARRAGGGVAAMEQVVEDNGVELYRAIEQLVEVDDRTVTEFREVWIDLDATKSEITQKASVQRVDDLTNELKTLSTTVVTGVDGLRVTVQDGEEIIARLNATIGGLENWVTDADGNVAELVNSVRGLESTVRTVDGRVSTLTNTADGLTSTISGQGNALSQLRTRIDEIAAEVDNGNGSVGSLRVEADRITQRVQAVGGKVTTLTTTADGLVSTVSDQTNRLSKIEQRIDEIKLQVTDATGAMGKILLTADRAVTTITSADERISSRINVIAGAIELETKADGSTVSLRLDAVDRSISAQAEKIELQAQKISVNASNITAKANRADLDAYLTVSAFETQFARLNQLETGVATATLFKTLKLQVTNDASFGSLSTPSATITNLKINGKEGSWQEQRIVEGVSLTLRKATLPIYSSAGTLVGNVEVVTDVTASTTRSTKTVLVA